MSRYFFALFCVLVLFFVECNTSGIESEVNFAAKNTKLIAKILAQNVQRTTFNTSACFDFYTPQLQNATAEWSNSYSDCINKADSDRETFMTQIDEDQLNILESSNEIIDYISGCGIKENNLDFFTCFASLNQNVLGTIYAISNKAMVDATLLNQQVNGINATMYLCTNAAEYAYVQQTAAINKGLNDCLQYGLLINENAPFVTE